MCSQRATQANLRLARADHDYQQWQRPTQQTPIIAEPQPTAG